MRCNGESGLRSDKKFGDTGLSLNHERERRSILEPVQLFPNPAINPISFQTGPEIYGQSSFQMLDSEGGLLNRGGGRTEE